MLLCNIYFSYCILPVLTYFDLETYIVGIEKGFNRTFTADVLSKHDVSKCCEQSVVHLKSACDFDDFLTKSIQAFFLFLFVGNLFVKNYLIIMCKCIIF